MKIRFLLILFMIVVVFISGCSTHIPELPTSENDESNSIINQETELEEDITKEEIKENSNNQTNETIKENENIILLSFDNESEENQFIVDIILEYEEKIINFSSKEYKIKSSKISETSGWDYSLSSVSLIINEELFEDLVDGEIFQLNDGTYLGIVRIFVTDAGSMSAYDYTQFYLGEDDSNFTPYKFDERLCLFDEDCIIMPYKCCLCNKNGLGNPMNKKYKEIYLEGCSEECSEPPFKENTDVADHWSCSANTTLKCINNKCHLIHPISEEPLINPYSEAGKKVRIITDKEDYSFDESIKVTIVNNNLIPIYFGSCKEEFNPFITIFKKTKKKDWSEFSIIKCQDEIPYKLDPERKRDYDFNIRIPNNDTTTAKYRLHFKYAVDEEAKQRYSIRSNAFIVE